MFVFRPVIFALLLALPGLAAADEVAAVLDAFHRAAGEGDEQRYLGLLTADAVFLGTDSTERWQGESFRQFVGEHFGPGRGWTYTVAERHIDRSADGRTAWFDELLDNAQLGRCRGSGVLLRTAAGWRIAQYNLSLPVPNEMALSVAQDIRALAQGAPDKRPVVEPAAPPEVQSAPAEAEAAADEAPAARCRKRHKTNSRADC